jgi:DNA-binding MarR family transcriptional regulator
MYLPSLGIDLREHFKASRIARPKWSPSTQAAFLFALIHGHEQRLTPKDLADRLGYAPMSLTRSFDELDAAELGRVVMEGKQRVLYITDFRGTVYI